MIYYTFQYTFKSFPNNYFQKYIYVLKFFSINIMYDLMTITMLKTRMALYNLN